MPLNRLILLTALFCRDCQTIGFDEAPVENCPKHDSKKGRQYQVAEHQHQRNDLGMPRKTEQDGSVHAQRMQNPDETEYHKTVYDEELVG